LVVGGEEGGVRRSKSRILFRSLVLEIEHEKEEKK